MGLANLSGSTVLVLDYHSVLYPRGLIEDQVRVVRCALEYARKTFPEQKLVCVGHSSGAHVSALAFLGNSPGEPPLADVFFAQVRACPKDRFRIPPFSLFFHC